MPRWYLTPSFPAILLEFYYSSFFFPMCLIESSVVKGYPIKHVLLLCSTWLNMLKISPKLKSINLHHFPPNSKTIGLARLVDELQGSMSLRRPLARMRLQEMATTPGSLCELRGNLNSESHACMADPLTTEPFPQPN